MREYRSQCPRRNRLAPRPIALKRGSRAAQRRHVATKKEGGLLAEEGERERGAHRLSISPHLAIREHIAGEGEGALSGVGRG